MKGPIVGTRIVLIVLSGLLALPLAQTASPVEAKKRSRMVTRTFTNPTAINTNAGLNFPSPVSAVVYPAPIAVRGLNGAIRDVNVRLHNFTHSDPSDVEVLLVGPRGQTAIVMANVGTANDADDATLRLDDEAEEDIPAGADPLLSGAYRPTYNRIIPVVFPAPAPPVTSANSALSVFDGANPNGTWRLFVQDSYGFDFPGAFQGGWTLEIKTKVKAKKKR